MQKSFKRLLTVAMVLAMLVSMMAMPIGATETDAVATVNGEPYTTLEAAIAALPAEGGIVELQKDVTVSTQIDSTAPFTLEGNGHTITSTVKRPLRLFHDATINNVTIENAT